MFLVPFCSFFHPSNDCLFSQKNQIKKKKKKEEGKKGGIHYNAILKPTKQ